MPEELQEREEKKPHITVFHLWICDLYLWVDFYSFKSQQVRLWRLIKSDLIKNLIKASINDQYRFARFPFGRNKHRKEPQTKWQKCAVTV